jgi:hypothetical protein
LIFGPVFEWLKQDARPFENRTKFLSGLSPFKYWTSLVFEWSWLSNGLD